MRTPEQIFQDLIKIDPSLADHTPEIMKSITALLEQKPNTRFDAKFAKKLRTELLKDSTSSASTATPHFMERVATFFAIPALRYGALACLMVALLGGGLYYGRTAFSTPTVVAGNWDFNYKKIPYNVPSIDITLSTDLKADSITKNTVKITPFVPGTPELKDGNIISYKLEKNLEIGKFYTIELADTIESRFGKSIGKPILYEIEAIGGLSVTRMIPSWSGSVTGLFKNPIIAFNIPVIPASSLSERDKLPCPVKFSPELKGRCTWPSGNILEYRLDAPMNAATMYTATVEIPNNAGFLYPMSQPFTAQFGTTPLTLTLGEYRDKGDNATDTSAVSDTQFAPSKGIILRLSAPVTKAELMKRLSIFKQANTPQDSLKSNPATPTNVPTVKTLQPGGGNSILYTLESKEGDAPSTRYALFAANGALEYGQTYTVALDAGLMPAAGNLASTQTFSTSITGLSFLENMRIETPIFTSTGAVDGYGDFGYANPNKLIPAEGAQLVFTFAEDIPLIPGSIRFESAGNQSVACNLSYLKKQVPTADGSLKMMSVDDKRNILCIFSGPLPVGTSGQIVFAQSLSRGLSDDVTEKATIARKFSASSFVALSPSKGCLYTTTPTSYWLWDVSLSNGGRFVGSNSDIYGTRTCPSIGDFYSTIMDVRMTPNSTSTLTIGAGARDALGQKIVAPYTEANIKVWSIGLSDQYLYTSTDKSIVTIPSDLPLVVSLQGVNIDTARVQVCELSADEYLAFRTAEDNYTPNYTPNCLSEVTKNIAIKNRNWNLSRTQFDVSEFLEQPLTSNFVLVRASVTDAFNTGERGYLQNNREFRTLYLRQNLPLALINGENSKLFASSFDGKTLPSDLTFQAMGSNSGGFSAQWNPATQLYDIKSGSAIPAVLIAKNSQYFGVLSGYRDENSNYDHGISGWVVSSDTLYTFLSSDRPIYRSGDEMQYKGILRELTPRGYRLSTAKSVKLRALADNGDELFSQILGVDSNSTFTGKFTLPREMRTGRYSFEVLTYSDAAAKVGGNYAVNDANFYVEQYVKPVFKVGFTESVRDVQVGDTSTLSAEAEYYFGGGVPNASATWTIMGQSYFFDAREFSNYNFGTGNSYAECRYWGICSNRDRTIGSRSVTLDGLGKTEQKYTHEFADPKNPSEEIITYNLEVTDPNTQRVVRNSTSQILHITDGYVGISSPYWIKSGDPIKFSGVLLNHDATIKSGAKARVTIARVEYKDTKKQWVDGAFYNEYERVETPETTIDVKSGGNGLFDGEFTPKNGGSFVVRAEYSGRNGKTFISETDAYVETDANSYWNLGNNSVTTLTAEKSVLKPGETAVLVLKSPIKSGRILVSIEKDSTVLSVYTQEISSYAPKIEVPILAQHLPNIYVRVYLIGRDGNNLPVYKRALAALKAMPDTMRLGVEVTAPKVSYLPGESLKVKVAVRDSAGKAVANADGSLTVVDESVLALVGNPLKNPFAFFYEMKRYLGTSLYLSLTNLVDKLEVKNTANGEKWGAWEGNKWGDAKKKRGNFKDTAFYTAHFTTDINGVAEVDVGALPDNLTTWSMEAIVATKTTQVGIGRAAITTQKRVMINDNLPRILRTGDTVELSPVVFNRTWSDGEFEVALTGSGFSGGQGIRLSLKNGESKTVPFTIKPSEFSLAQSIAYANIELKATALSTKEQDEISRTLPVIRSESKEVVATIGRTKWVSFDETLNLAGVNKNTAEFTLTTAASLIGNATDGLASLAQYPYGCIEQKTSAALPIALAKSLANALGQPYDLSTLSLDYYDPINRILTKRSQQNALEDYRAQILMHELPSGWLSYWKEDLYKIADLRMTAYLVRNSSTFAAVGVPLNAGMLSRNMNYLAERLRIGEYEWCNGACPISLVDKLAATAALAHGGGYDSALRNWELISRVPRTVSGEVGALDILAGLIASKEVSPSQKEVFEKVAREIVENIVQKEIIYNPRWAYLSAEVNGSRVLATAEFVLRLSDLGMQSVVGDEMIENMLRFLAAAKKSDGSYGSTQETIAVIKAFTTRVKSEKAAAGESMTTWVNLNGQEIARSTFTSANFTTGVKTSVSLAWVGDRSTVNFGLTGSGWVYYTLELAYPVSAKDILARDEGFFVTTEYYDQTEYARVREIKLQENEEYLRGEKNMNDFKYPREIREYVKPLTQMRVGQLITVEYRLILAEDRDYVAMESFIPAGAEVVNTRLATESLLKKDDTPFTTDDYRDDRYFGYAQTLVAGEHSGSYTIRATHAGTFMTPATRVFEFNSPEVFGQTMGREMKIVK
jgi:uncharacterized protein YfaS (alpha-2-macroglobulin family)